jgi:SH3-like domain-containing protein
MFMAWARHGLLAIAAGVIVNMIGMAAGQDIPRMVPQPRPVTLPAPEPAAPPTADLADGLADEPEVQAPALVIDAAPQTASGPQLGPVTGFPLPRYVSIKANEANARRGPSRSHRIDWVFQRRNMPVMVVAEHGQWRRIVDRDGAGGWVHHTLLSGVRTAIVDVEDLPILARPERGGTVRAQAQRDVIAALRRCRNGWCEIEAGGFRGWVDASGLWGVEPGEDF